MRTLLFVVLAVISIPAAFITWYRWDSTRNRGWEFGYFGDYNGISNALASIPGVTITQAWHNLDITLEEFGFGICVTGRPVQLIFGETDKIRELRQQAAVVALEQLIQTELSSSGNSR
jgi:hypothetical protein